MEHFEDDQTILKENEVTTIVKVIISLLTPLRFMFLNLLSYWLEAGADRCGQWHKGMLL